MAIRGGAVVTAGALLMGAFAVYANADTIKSQVVRMVQRSSHHAHQRTVVAKEHRLMNLKNCTAHHDSPDAIVFVPAGFDPDGPLNVLIYNHGLTNNLDDAYSFWELDRAMRYAPKNTVMILPEWAKSPEEYSAEAGPFHQPNFFRNMLAEIFNKTPELQDRSVDDISKITIATFSGGFRASRSEIERNGLGDKVVGIICLDSLYETDYFDNWLRTNMQDIAAGKKFYHNFYFDTVTNSHEQLVRVRKMIADAGLPQSIVYVDREHEKQKITADVIQQHPILYIYTSMYSNDRTAHQQAAYLYFPEALKAITAKERSRHIANASNNIHIRRID